MLGVQLFGLSGLLKTDRMPTLRKLCDMGIEAVEPYVPLANKEIAAFESAFEEFKALGLSVPSAHTSPALFGRRPAKFSRNLVLIQEKTDISVFVFSGMFSKESAAQRWGRLLGNVARAVSDSGITILYHNHDMELRPVGSGGRTAMDASGHNDWPK